MHSGKAIYKQKKGITNRPAYLSISPLDGCRYFIRDVEDDDVVVLSQLHISASLKTNDLLSKINQIDERNSCVVILISDNMLSSLVK
jgi:hypothetical protein